jgi:hypothetical protein
LKILQAVFAKAGVTLPLRNDTTLKERIKERLQVYRDELKGALEGASSVNLTLDV